MFAWSKTSLSCAWGKHPLLCHTVFNPRQQVSSCVRVCVMKVLLLKATTKHSGISRAIFARETATDFTVIRETLLLTWNLFCVCVFVRIFFLNADVFVRGAIRKGRWFYVSGWRLRIRSTKLRINDLISNRPVSLFVLLACVGAIWLTMIDFCLTRFSKIHVYIFKEKL